MQQYTNELTPEILTGLNQSPFTPEQLAVIDNEVLRQIEEQQVFCSAHPITSIYRIAVAGCITQKGGTGVEFNPIAEQGHKIQCEDGVMRSVLTKGCTVSYPDGQTAQIISSAGNRFTSSDGRGIALVGSKLDNGDVIIGTPQRFCLLTGRESIEAPADFLTIEG